MEHFDFFDPNNIHALVTWTAETYPKGQTSAAQARPLVELLERMSAMAKAAGEQQDLGFAAQWPKDFERFQERVKGYRRVLDRELERDPHSVSSEAVQVELLDPIVYGWYEGVDVRRPPDVSTGVSLVNQANVADEAMRDASNQFWEDVGAPFKITKKSVGIWGFLGGVAAVALGALAWSRR